MPTSSPSPPRAVLQTDMAGVVHFPTTSAGWRCRARVFSLLGLSVMMTHEAIEIVPASPPVRILRPARFETSSPSSSASPKSRQILTYEVDFLKDQTSWPAASSQRMRPPRPPSPPFHPDSLRKKLDRDVNRKSLPILRLRRVGTPPQCLSNACGSRRQSRCSAALFNPKHRSAVCL